jgi:hypothetical protein
MSNPVSGSVLLLTLCLGIAVPRGEARGLHTATAEHKVMSGRIVAKVPLERLSTFGLNYESYIFEVYTDGKHSTKQLIKLSYRFDQREPRLPNSFFDYSLTHTFRMTRDEDCDESWEGVSSRFLFDDAGGFHGRQTALIYANNAPVTEVDSPLKLACYVATPHDYKATSKNHTEPAKASAIKPHALRENAALHAKPESNSSSQTVVMKVASTHQEER